MNCPNCNNKMSCGCQKRTASDGKTVCDKCVNFYQARINNVATQPQPTPQNNNIAPSNINVKYIPPKLN